MSLTGILECCIEEVTPNSGDMLVCGIGSGHERVLLILHFDFFRVLLYLFL